MFSPLRRDPTVQESRAHSSVTSKIIAALTGPRPVIVGNTVLTLETGGVALFALQVTKLCGARVIVMTSSDEKIEKALGADEVMNYSMIPDRECVVRELTGGRSVDHVIETRGVETLERSIKSVAPQVWPRRSVPGVRPVYVGSAAAAVARSRCLPKVTWSRGATTAPAPGRAANHGESGGL
jgi:hypothetical protein